MREKDPCSHTVPVIQEMNYKSVITKVAVSCGHFHLHIKMEYSA